MKRGFANFLVHPEFRLVLVPEDFLALLRPQTWFSQVRLLILKISKVFTNTTTVGQASYNSTITLQEEMLPIAVSIVAAKGCDGIVFTLAEQLLAAGILKSPKVGTLAF